MTEKEKQYQEILIQICQERGLDRLTEHLVGFTGEKEPAVAAAQYRITKMPEAACDGCQ